MVLKENFFYSYNLFVKNRREEIVDNENLTFKNIDNTVLNIEKVLKNKKLQEELRKHLKTQSKKFSAEKFKKEVKELVDNYLKGGKENIT